MYRRFEQTLYRCFSKNSITGQRFRHHTPGNSEEFQQLFIPVQSMNIKKHGTRRIRIISQMLPAFGQFPNQPGINSSHQQIAFFCQFTCIFHVIQYPLSTTGRKIRIDKQSGLSLYQFAVSLIFQFFANSRSPLALPYHGMINGLAGMSVPNNHRFALIGDGKRIRNILSIHFFLFKQTMYRFYGIFIDFFGIMLYPSYLRVELLMFYIYPMQQFAIFREQHGFCCRSTLIYGNYSANHTIRFKKDMFIFSRIQGQSCRCPLYPIRNGQRFHESFHEPRSHRGCR